MFLFAILKKPLVYRAFAVSVLFALVACNSAQLMQKFTSPQEQALAKHYIDLLRHRQFDQIEAVADKTIAGADLHGTLVAMADLLPPGEPISVLLVGAHRLQQGESTTVNLTFEFGYAHQWVLSNVAVKSQAGGSTIVGFSVIPEPASLEQQNGFTLTGKNAMQYFVLALAILASALTLFALAVCIRTRLRGRKWPWVLFILFGFGNLSVNWASGAWGFTPLAIQMFSGAAVAQLYGPWIVSASFPLGAIVFLMRRKSLTRDFAAVDTPLGTHAQVLTGGES